MKRYALELFTNTYWDLPSELTYELVGLIFGNRDHTPRDRRRV